MTPPREVDVQTGPEFAQRVQDAVEQFPPVLVIDFSDVAFAGGTAVDVLLYAKEVVASYGGRLRIRHLSRALRRLLALTPEFADDASVIAPGEGPAGDVG